MSKSVPGVKDAQVVEKLNVAGLKFDRVGTILRCLLQHSERLDLFFRQSGGSNAISVGCCADQMTTVEKEDGTMIGKVEKQRPKCPLRRISEPDETFRRASGPPLGKSQRSRVSHLPVERPACLGKDGDYVGLRRGDHIVYVSA